MPVCRSKFSFKLKHVLLAQHCSYILFWIPPHPRPLLPKKSPRGKETKKWNPFARPRSSRPWYPLAAPAKGQKKAIPRERGVLRKTLFDVGRGRNGFSSPKVRMQKSSCHSITGKRSENWRNQLVSEFWSGGGRRALVRLPKISAQISLYNFVNLP